MTEPNLDEILAGLSNYIVESIHLQPTPVRMIKLNQRQAKAQIEALIANQVREARIDELEKQVEMFEWGKGTDNLTDRIKALQEQK